MDKAVEVLDKALPMDGDIKLRDGRVVAIRKCQLRQLGAIAKLVQKVKALAMTDPIVADAIAGANGDFTILMKDTLFVTQIIVNLETDVYAVLSGFCGLTVDELGALELDEALHIISRVIGDNMDFFVRQVLPMIVGIVEAKAAEIEMLARKIGVPQSSGVSSS